jgi:PAS domain S-box-containing protein
MTESLAMSVDEGVAAENLDLISHVQKISSAHDVVLAQVFTTTWHQLDTYPRGGSIIPPDIEAVRHFATSQLPFYQNRLEHMDFYSPVFYHQFNKSHGSRYVIGYVRIQLSSGQSIAALNKTIVNHAAIFLVATVLTIIVFTIFIRKLVLLPLSSLRQSVSASIQEDLPLPVPVSGNDEIGELSQAFNEMCAGLRIRDERLHEQTVMLEEEIAERQLAQECLQEQAAQLEEEIGERQLTQESLEEQSQRLEEEIAERRRVEEKLRIIFDTAQAGIIMVDANGIISFANRYAHELYRLDTGDITGSRYVEHVFPNERELSISSLQSLLNGSVEWLSTERHYLRLDGGDFWGLISARRHLDECGTLISAIIVINDITEQKNAALEREQLQQKYIQSQKMEAVGRLAGGIAHDFNNKLTVILGYAEMLKMNTKSMDQEQIGRLDEILRAANQSCEITRQLLAFSRREIVTPQKVNINSILEDSRKSLGRLIGEDITFEFKPALDLWSTMLDPTQIDQIIMNLAVNARDAMPNGGLFSIRTENVYIDKLHSREIENASPGYYVNLIVSDTGCGMDNETLKHIFEPFFTTKESGKGTGLGLATIYGIVTQNKGFICVFSETGFGTTFKIYFPGLVLDNIISPEDRPGTGIVSGNGTILVVEDEESLLNMTSEMLIQLGYHTIVAHSPTEAIALCKSEEYAKIDLILTDVVMPDMNGKEMSDRILAFRPDIPVLFMSGFTADIIASKGILEESVHFIQKPFNLLKLSLMVRDTIG